MHMECTHGGGEAEQGSSSVEWSGGRAARGLGRGHEFMHELEREGKECLLFRLLAQENGGVERMGMGALGQGWRAQGRAGLGIVG